MTKQLRVLIAQGHRNTTGGNPAEIAITPIAARAIQKALRAAGHIADMVQNDNDWFEGSLDAVGREVVRRHNLAPYDLLLDVHFEGDANNTRGVFAIVPDGDGLRTVSPYLGSDAWRTNTLDQSYALAITREVSAATGPSLRKSGVKLPGVMSERQTGVGSKGYRLAMFGYTAVARDRLVRLVLELGNITGDADIIKSPGFFERAAQGVVHGVQRVLVESNVVSISSAKPVGIPAFGTMVRLRQPLLVTVTVDALNARKWAETNQPIMRMLNAGNSFYARGWIVGETVEGNPLWWVMGRGLPTDLLWRVWSGGTDFGVDDILAMSRKEAA